MALMHSEVKRYVILTSVTIRSRILAYVRSSCLLKRYSVGKMLLELHKVMKLILQDGEEITREITRKKKETLKSLGIKPKHMPTFFKSWGTMIYTAENILVRKGPEKGPEMFVSWFSSTNNYGIL